MPTPQNRRLTWPLLAAAAAASVALAGCTGDTEPATDRASEPATGGPELTIDDITGIWHTRDWEGLLLRFSPDGTAAIDNGGDLERSPCVPATYELADGTMRFTANADALCCPDDTWTWQVDMPEDGRLDVVYTDGGCGADTDDAWTLVRVSPQSPGGSAITAAEPAETPVAAAGQLGGVWLREGTGHLLRLSGNGTYATDDAGGLGVDPADSGTVEVPEDGVLRFTSDGSRTCDAGQGWFWTEARFGQGVLQATVSEDPCGDQAGTEWTWVRLSP